MYIYIYIYWTWNTVARVYIDDNAWRFPTYMPIYYTLCLCSWAVDKTFVIYEVLLSVWQCSLGSRPSTNYCPSDGLLTMVAERLSSKPLIGIRYATPSKRDKNVQDRSAHCCDLLLLCNRWFNPYPSGLLHWLQNELTISHVSQLQH